MRGRAWIVLLVILCSVIPVAAQEGPSVTAVEVDPASIDMPEAAWLNENFEQANDDWAWCGSAHRTDWPYSPNGQYHAYFGGYVNGVDGLMTMDCIRTGILADPQTWCWDWMMKTTELPYRIDVAVANIYGPDGDLLVGVWERDNRDADSQWRRFCVEITGLSNYPAARAYWGLHNDFSNATSLHIDNVVWVADEKYPAPGPERIYLPLSVRDSRRYQKCRVCQLLPSGDTTTVCISVDNCSKGSYPPCPILPGPYWSWTTIDRYCERY